MEVASDVAQVAILFVGRARGDWIVFDNNVDRDDGPSPQKMNYSTPSLIRQSVIWNNQ